MPEVRFRIRWPDGSEDLCYSPSTVARDYFAAGDEHALAAFITISDRALTAASRRVEARYGVPCSRAAGQMQALRQKAGTQPDGVVTVISIE